MTDNVIQLHPDITIDNGRGELAKWLRQIADQIEIDRETPIAVALLVRADDGSTLAQATGFCDNEKAAAYFTRAMGDRIGWA